MPAENGITAAKEIRQYDNVVKIIFLTSSAEFAVESYVVDAYFYQLKPIWEDSLFRLTDSVIAECRRADQRSLIHEITQEYGITTIINTHDMNSVMEIGEKIVYIHDGRKWWEGTKDDILHADNRELNDFVFASAMAKRAKLAAQ